MGTIQSFFAALKAAIGWCIATVYDIWGTLPTTAQTALRNLFYAGLGFALAFGWTLPANLAGVRVEWLLFWQGFSQVLAAVINKQILPNLLVWLIQIFDLEFDQRGGRFGHKVLFLA